MHCPAVGPGKDRFKKRYEAAVLGSDTEEKDRLDNFRSDLTAFINAYVSLDNGLRKK